MKGTYEVTYKCRHKGYVEIDCRPKNLEWKIKSFEGVECPKCIAEKQAQQSAEAAKRNKEEHLPELFGTEKQIAWAEKIRREQVDAIEQLTQEEIKGHKRYTRYQDEWMLRALKIIKEEVSQEELAEKFIENRRTPYWFVRNWACELAVQLEKGRYIVPLLVSEHKTKPGYVNLRYFCNIPELGVYRMEARYPYDKSFVSCVKKYALVWHPAEKMWGRKFVTEPGGNIGEDFCKLVKDLSKRGFAVRLSDKEAIDLYSEGKDGVCE